MSQTIQHPLPESLLAARSAMRELKERYERTYQEFAALSSDKGYQKESKRWDAHWTPIWKAWKDRCLDESADCHSPPVDWRAVIKRQNAEARELRLQEEQGFPLVRRWRELAEELQAMNVYRSTYGQTILYSRGNGYGEYDRVYEQWVTEEQAYAFAQLLPCRPEID